MRHLGSVGRRHSPDGSPGELIDPVRPDDYELFFRDVRGLVEAQLRRDCRRRDFDWERLRSEVSDWSVAEVVHRRVLNRAGARSGVVGPDDIRLEGVRGVVRAVMDDWEVHVQLRPTREGFCREQGRRGEKGRETQRAQAEEREARVMALVSEGVGGDAEIAGLVGVNRATVWRIRARVAARSSVEPEPCPDTAPFPAPEIPRWERWPAVQFMKQTGVAIDANQVRWLADMGRCCEAEGCEDDLMEAIKSSAGEGVRDPWAYLQRCIANRGDAWTVSPQLLADVLSWAGQKALEYALVAIGGGYVRRPLPYLRKVLADAVATGRRPDGRPERPVAAAVVMARRRCPGLEIEGADAAAAAEESGLRSRQVDSFRRLFGRLPWESDPAVEAGADCCVGLLGPKGDDSSSISIWGKKIEETSPRIPKADATLDPGAAGWSDPQAASLTVGRGDGAKGVGAGHGERCAPDPLRENRRCQHPASAALSSMMVLEDVVPVACLAGCGHWLYSDRGPLRCPCCWPVAGSVRLARAIERGVAADGVLAGVAG